MVVFRGSLARTTPWRSGVRSFPPVAYLWRQLGYRTYATGHAPKKAGSDLPWLITSIAVTVPACAYLLQPKAKDDHGHGDHGHSQTHAHQTREEEASTEGGEVEDHEETDDSESTGDAGEENTPSGSDDDEDAEGHEDDDSTKDGEEDSSDSHVTVEGKGPTADSPIGKGPRKDGPAGDTRKHIEDSSKGAKKRIDSDYGHHQGEAEATAPEGSDRPTDQAATSKPALSKNYMSGKQEGVSNTDTKFPVDLMGDHPTPQKGEGVPESAKNKGTIDPNRTPPEQRKGKKNDGE